MTDEVTKDPLKYFSRFLFLNYPRALVYLVMGFIAVFAPGKTIVILVRVLGWLLFADGVILVIQSVFSIGYDKKWYLFLLRAGVSVLAGAVPVFAGSAIVVGNVVLYILFIAAVNLFCGTMDVVRAFRYRIFLNTELVTVLGGAICFALGIFLLSSSIGFFPGMMVLIGGILLVYGVFTGWATFRHGKKGASDEIRK